MFKPILLLPALALCCGIGVDSSAPPSSSSIFECVIGSMLDCFKYRKIKTDQIKYTEYYDDIEKVLNKKISSSDLAKATEKPKDFAEAMMKVIEDLINQEKGRDLNNDPFYLKALVQIQGLTLTAGPGRCDLSTSRILQNNDISLKDAISSLTPNRTPTRSIEKLVNYYADAFMRECYKDDLLDLIGPESKRYIEGIVGEYIGSRGSDNNKNLIFQTIRNVSPLMFIVEQPEAAKKITESLKRNIFRSPKDPEIVYCWLMKFTKKEQDQLSDCMKRTSKVNYDNLRALFKKYLGEPCADLVKKAEGVFGSDWSQSILEKRLSEKAKFYRNLAYYYGCKNIASIESKLIRGLAEIVEGQHVVGYFFKVKRDEPNCKNE